MIVLSTVLALAGLADAAEAQDTADVRVIREGDIDREVAPAEVRAAPRLPSVFVEGTGSYGVQFGETSYLPSGAPGQYMHPIVHGFAVGGTAGVFVVHDTVALVANYEYTNARSRHGSITGVLDDVQGSIEYHTATVGMRLRAPTGFGAFHAEAAGGVVFPYETELQFDYGAALTQLPTPITGTGLRTDHYSVGFGGSALIGYEIPIFDCFYLAVNAKLRLFEAENAGETTDLDNVVTDFAATPPTATDATIAYGNGAAQPSTNSVQDVRLQLALGAAF